MNEKRVILVIEDERTISNFICRALNANDYKSIPAFSGKEGLSLFFSHSPDLVLLDLGLPDMDGLGIIRQVRAWSKMPIVVVSARDRERDKVEALDLGADYYLTKPFGVMELVSCVKAVLRRCARPSHVLHLSGLTLDQDAHTVSCDGQRVPLTYKEYELLRLFLSHPGMAFTRDQLMAQVWGTDYYGETRTVDMHIRTLRQKLGPYGGLIQTVRNVGYRLEEQG